MDSLDDFEKTLAAEKAERERAAQKEEERRERKHRHRHRDRSSERHRDREHRDKDRDRDREGDRGKDRHHRSRENDEEDGHRHKRSRRDDDRDDESKYRSRRHRSRERKDHGKESKHAKTSDPHEDLPLPDDERAQSDPKPLQRDSWMTAPSAIDIDYVQRGKKSPSPPVKEEPQRVLHHRELNRGLGDPMETDQPPPKREANYKFGDEGSQWRMTKLKSVYTISENTGRSVDDVAVERFGTLEEFDEAREEKIEMDRRKVYGEGYIGKEKPTGDLFSERKPSGPSPDSDADSPPPQGVVVPEPAAPMDQTALNRLRAALMRAKLRNDPSAPRLEAEFNAAMASYTPPPSSSAIVLDASHSRLLAGTRAEAKPITTSRGVARGLVEANDDMSVSDMVREERRTRGVAGGEGLRLAERIAKDTKFSSDLEYLDENAEKLARRVHKGEASLKHMAVAEYRSLNAALDRCPLCHHEDRTPPTPTASVVALATRVYLTLPPAPELTGAEGGAVLVPVTHRANLLECDDDEWEELRNFMKSLTRMYHAQGRAVLFYENAAAPRRRRHAALVAVPIPWALGDTAPAFFREAMLSADEEWAQHKKIIDTGKRAKEGLGKAAFRRSLAKEMPYFHVWFTLDGGLGHVVEDEGRWPRGDLFAREIVGGMVDAEPDVIKREGRWARGDERVEGWRKKWRKFDWTRVLAEEG